MRVVICGGGIIGCSTAYYLSQKGVGATVVDRCGIACAASGKAGGFLARNWSTGPMGQFSQKSFDLHMELSKSFTDCDYRRVNTLSLEVGGTKRTKNTLPDWIDGGIETVSSLGTPETTAQVHPYKLSNAFIDAAKKSASATVVIGTVEDVVVDNGKVTGVKVSSEVIPADVVVIAMGPWTGQASKWFPGLPEVVGSPAHSIVLKPRPGGVEIGADCLFAEFSSGPSVSSPEVYPRPDGTVYVCGGGERPPLPADPQEIRSTERTRAELQKVAGAVCRQLADAEVLRSDCCFLPCPTGRVPMIGRIPGVGGAYVAAGHTCWGILNAPVTGACLAELIVDGKCTLTKLDAFDPANF